MVRWKEGCGKKFCGIVVKKILCREVDEEVG